MENGPCRLHLHYINPTLPLGGIQHLTMKIRLYPAAIILVLAAPFVKAQDKPYMEDLPYYVENLEVFGAGQEDGRAYNIPPQNILLNGSWKFLYGESPYEIPSDFFKPSFSDRKWSDIKVPSNWEMQGFGQPLFRNTCTPFPFYTDPEDRALGMRSFGLTPEMQRMMGGGNARPNAQGTAARPAPQIPEFAVSAPNVPMDFNPTGAYRTSFTIPRDWKGQQVFLRFEKVASASFVWVNGQQVGYNEGAQEPSEYNITKYVKPGKNTLAVLVLKYSDGYYMEAQDYWRLAGIFDDVWVYSTPQARIWDWQVITDFDKDYKDSELDLKVEVRGYDINASGFSLEAVVSKDGRQVAAMSKDGLTVGPGSKQTVSFRTRVASPEKWSSETPVLYDLCMTLKDGSGKAVESVVKRIGFKKTEIINGVFYLNGVPIKVNAQCSHMQHPVTGHAMDEATIRRDIEILKQFNFNAVRTSHYPPVHRYLELADEYGLFVIDETGDEAHSSEYISYKEEWIPMYQERVRQMVLRDRNHACVLFWSAGNESGEGPNIGEVVKEGKKYDPTRYWMYGGNAAVHPAEDIVGPRYPSPIEHEMRYGVDRSDNRPSFMDEYLSVAGNGGGGMDDYWNEIYAHPSLMGGAIWDFVSVGIKEPVRTLTDKSPYATQANIMGRAKLVPGRTGKAIDLNKQDQWVQVYRADNVEISGDRLTLVLDIYPRLYNRSGGYLITKGNNQFGLKQQGRDKLDFYIDNGSKQTLTADLPSDWENNWHNVAAVYDGKTMRIFIDGGEAASQPMEGNIRNLPLSLCIGRSEEALGQETNVYICDAIIDNVGVFDMALTPADGFNASESVLWLDFEEEKTDGEFYSYGIGARTYGSIWADRTPQPEMYQMKKTVQPLSFKLVDPENGIVEVWNRNHFTNASFYKTTWTLTADEDVVASGVLALDVDPLGRKVISIPVTRPQNPVPGAEYRLNISSVLKDDELWAPAGHEVSWDQFEMKSWNVPARPAKIDGKVSLIKDEKVITASGEGFSYCFNAKTGELVSVVYGGVEMLSSPLRLNVWRAPLANELDGWNSRGARASVSGYGSIGHSSVLAGIYYAAGLDRVGNLPIAVDARQVGGDVLVEVRSIDILGSEERQLDQYIMGRSFNGFENRFSYVIRPDGTLSVHHVVNPQGDMPAWLPRIGVTLSLNGSLDNVRWHGRGPQASYPDRKSGYRLGFWDTTVEEMYEPYLIPQDYGLRSDSRWVRFTGRDGKGMEFSMDQPFAFNAYGYTTDNLTKAVYQYQLHPSGDITLNLDYATSGVGCTARGIFDAYRAYPGGYERTINIKPVEK